MEKKDEPEIMREISLEDKLFLDDFKVDKKAHLKIDTSLCRKCRDKPCLFVCPVGNYQRENGVVSLSWEGCLECGTCRLACPYGAIDWNYPQGGFGVKYRYG